MIFQRLTIKNFLTIEYAELDLDNRGLVLIQGVNNDDTSANSNGAGKSSIMDALCWVLYGTTARGLTTDAVVNNKIQKDCCVTLTIDDGNDVIKIVRYRRDKEHNNAIYVTVENETGVTDLTKGTNPQTQQLITQIIGCSHDVFIASVYAGQEKMPDLPMMTDKQLKLLIEEASGTDVLDKAYSIARDRMSAEKAKADTLKRQSCNLKVQIDNENQYLESLLKQQNEFYADIKNKVVETIETAKVRKTELEKLLQENPNIEQRLQQAEQRYLKSRQALANIQKVNETYIKTRTALDILQGRNMHTSEDRFELKRQLRDLKQKLTDLDAKVGVPCSVCKRPHTKESLDSEREAIKAEIAQKLAQLKQTQAELVKEANEIEDLQKALQQAETAQDEARRLIQNINAIEQEYQSLKDLDKQVVELKNYLFSVKERVNELKATEDPYSRLIQERKENTEKLVEQDMALQKDIEALDSNVALLEEAVNVFAPSGVRGIILDSVTPFLNERTAHYLGCLSDDNIHAVWTTLAQNKQGELKEKFNIVVTNDKGAASFAGLSGGEKRKVRLATCLALQDLVSSRAIKPIQLFIGDEIDHAIDSTSLEALMEVLNQKALEKGSVFVISHNDLKDYADNVITVNKAGGFSTIVGCNLK